MKEYLCQLIYSLSPSMSTVAVFVAGLTTTIPGELLVSSTVKVSRFSGIPSCRMLMVVQNWDPRAVPTGRSTTSFMRGVKSAEAI